jgi:hypothetical protein
VRSATRLALAGRTIGGLPALVAPEHRPTLRDELARAPRGVGRVLGALAALAVAAALVLALRGDGGIREVRRGAVTFNLTRPAWLRERPAGAGELLHLQARRRGRLFAELVVSPLRLPAYAGDAAGVLPLVAEQELRALRRRYPGLRLVQEGKAQLNQMPGYSIAFRIRDRPRLYGRELLLPQPGAGTRVGVRLLLLGGRSAGVANATQLGNRGALRRTYRSFAFGTRGP